MLFRAHAIDASVGARAVRSGGRECFCGLLGQFIGWRLDEHGAAIFGLNAKIPSLGDLLDRVREDATKEDDRPLPLLEYLRVNGCIIMARVWVSSRNLARSSSTVLAEPRQV